MRQVADACSDELHHRIGEAADDAERRDLTALRRSIHHGRAPKKPPTPTPPTPTPAVTQWLAARDTRERLRDAVVEGCTQAADRERGGLAALLGDDDLLRSLTLVAPEVHQEAERYRAAVLGPGKVSARKSERGLIQYVTRAMVRTSPLSRFTVVGIAEPTASTRPSARRSRATSRSSRDSASTGAPSPSTGSPTRRVAPSCASGSAPAGTSSATRCPAAATSASPRPSP
ncbi:hypothetical protein ACFRAO_17125 [Streptomyces sp. NPDC056656]|uniref:hypothetical protein n=1 Tax=Streptomyces sp. NPDC056656 TaxID=3345895 RepID=UPI0036AD23B4